MAPRQRNETAPPQPRHSRRRGASFITLEVRARNLAAIALYADFGFRQVAVRKGYYAGREDALIMECELEAAGPSNKD